MEQIPIPPRIPGIWRD